MILIKECKNNNEVYFESQVIEDNKIVFSNIINYKALIKELSGKTYLMLYDTNMKPITETFVFLNHDGPINSRIKSLQALKLLYCFQTIINKKIKDFKYSDITNLKHFLKGISPKGKVRSFELQTSRNNETVNGYISVYRQYAIYLGVENKALMQKKSNEILINLPDFEINFSTFSYNTSEKVPKKVIEIPRYISVDDLKKIIKEVRTIYGKLEECIIRLMFECGLRIGETLGLTADDLLMEQEEDLFVSVAYIRNRLSDKKDQRAKTCMNIIDKKEYKSKEYKIAGYGYQKIIIPIDLYNLINEYIEEAHIIARDEKGKDYYKYTQADRVRKSKPHEDTNYYIFINSLGKPMLSHLWNQRLRKIFGAVGIKVDKGVRKHNLNHKFRHGFAMFHVQHLKFKELELMVEMRHTNIASVARYYKPTTSDAIKIKTDFAESLYKIIPSLKS